ncbi:MauE/DoxX family redox-associated membrane protein [Paucibacter sp. R3-3]|uniref:Methylamine utilization protein MauE n=1 Tax=Roseateles agri TaxID=3098619 RepID=A0ABU5DG11_9BURK|nr:MauE/DoxX family redox-associated membrane protein [Paucibacter sp. R3-3]MDY0745223.1 MauE/DoxX family redox-associated membrane protein [Paucibacter sp. R3-3]
MDPVLGHSAAASLAAVLLIGAQAKLREQEIFRGAIDAYRLVPPAAVAPLALLLPLVEAAAGGLLLVTSTRVLGAVLAIALLLLVTGAVAINLRRGRDRIDCGCGGEIHTPLSLGLVARNAVLMGLALVAAASPTLRATNGLDLFAIAASTLFLLGLYSVATTLLSHQPRLNDLRKNA